MVIKRTVVVLSVAILALAACGSDKDSGSAGTAATSAADSAATDTAATDTAAVGSPSPSAAGGDHCAVTITGAVTRSWTSDESGFQAFVYGGWLVDPSAEDKDAFALNCYDADYNIIGFTSTPGTAIPMTPGAYDIASAAAPGGQLQADVALLFDDGSWDPVGGSLEIVEFDDSHISGTFSVAVKDSFDDSRTAQVTGEFAHSN